LDSTIFIRNIPYEADEKSLKKFMKGFGEILVCKLVINKDTEEHKGTAFVKFKDAQVA
jgi:RNA recognition motif-containing protein